VYNGTAWAPAFLPLLGDVTGTNAVNTVTAIRNINVLATAPTTNQFMRYNGAAWAPATVAVGDFCDIKLSYTTADLNGWVTMDGRLLTTLTPAQQAIATGCGIVTTLPNMTGRYPVGGVPGTLSGSATVTLVQANLPAITLTTGNTSAGTPTGTISHTSGADGNHTTPLNVYSGSTGDGFDPNVTSGVTNFQMTDRTPESIGNTSASPAGGAHTHSLTFTGATMGTHSHTVPLGGSGTAFNISPVSTAFRFKIYLGL
jgi:hypothetical protein